MAIWSRFWRVTATWALIGATLYTAGALWQELTGPAAHGWFGTWATLRVLPTAIGLFLPLAAFAGGWSIGEGATRSLAYGGPGDQSQAC
jgi:hypothetical protein